MSFSEALPFIMVGVLISLLPIGVIGLFASKLPSERRVAYLAIYAALVFLLLVMLGDVMGAVPSRLAVDLVLLVGGLAVGVYAGELFPVRLRGGTRHHA
jgi:Na+/serine symporter